MYELDIEDQVFVSVKFKYCEKATELEKNHSLVLTFTQQRQEKWEVVFKFLGPSPNTTILTYQKISSFTYEM